jgi:hypothetical protein
MHLKILTKLKKRNKFLSALNKLHFSEQLLVGKICSWKNFIFEQKLCYTKAFIHIFQLVFSYNS